MNRALAKDSGFKSLYHLNFNFSNPLNGHELPCEVIPVNNATGNMKVCIDIQSAIAQRAGVGRYTKSLVEHLGACADEDQLQLFYFDFKQKGFPFTAPKTTQRAISWCPGRVAQKAWKLFDWPPFDYFSGPADLYHFPNFVIPPLRRGRMVVTIHDVSFIRYPDAAEPKNLRFLSHQIRKTADRADLILTVSRFSADEISECLQLPPDRIQAIHLGLTANMGRPSDDVIGQMRRVLNLDKPYVLFVGTLEPRKNIPFLIEVFEHMNAFDGDLVVAGMRGWKYEPILERIHASSKRHRIHYLEYVDERWLPALYAGAELFLFPSLYEGFGFPPLESMRCGTAVLSSRAGSLPEVLGAASDYVAEYDAAAWAQAAMEVLQDASRQNRLRDAGFQQAGRYRWERTARETWKAYCEVVG